ncbi:hypothetical protein CsatB_000134 [Cannabis sativa]
MSIIERNNVEEDESFFYAIELRSLVVLPMSLFATIELGVFEILAKAGDGAKLSSSDIVSHLPTKNLDAPMMLDRILTLLASHSVLDCVVVGEGSSMRKLYSLSPVSKHFLLEAHGASSHAIMKLGLDKVFLESWFELKNAVLEGGSAFKRAHGMNVFEYGKLDPRFGEVFNSVMYNQAIVVTKKLIESYKGFENNIETLVDVGGGCGVTISLIVSKYPQIKAINFDLPHIIKNAPTYPGVEHVAGDMFEKIPNGDAIFMKWILHDWNDEDCVKILKKCYEATPSNGKVINVDMVVPIMAETTHEAKSIFQSDLVMLSQIPGGKERNQHEFQTIANAAGFKTINFACPIGNVRVMEFIK